MCGVTGLWDNQVDPALLARMTRQLFHRGPDSTGSWSDHAAGLSLGHARLAILDLSPMGAQPMHSACGRYVISFNGEIYNHLGLRRELEGSGHAPAWRGSSDTESLLACLSAHGLGGMLRRTVGMFALAIWDRQERVVHLARDRIGEKPLYYGFAGKAFVFASELKALKAFPGFNASVNRSALALYMRHSMVPAPHSIYDGIFKLPAGCSLTLHQEDWSNSRLPTPQPYWHLLDVAQAGDADRSGISDSAAIAGLDQVLRQSIASQMVADVPLGAFLSGGIDSSVVVALMQAQSARAVKTFTIGFREDDYDEARHAKAVARHLGTEHTEMYVTSQDALAVIPKLPQMYCEPFSDSSQIPTFLVSQLARQHVKVSLSGDGGDELFGGYARYDLALRSWNLISRMPRMMRRSVSAALRALPVAGWNVLSPLVRPLLPASSRAVLVGDKIHKGAELLLADSDVQFYWDGFASHWRSADVVLGGKEPENGLLAMAKDLPSLLEKMMLLDALSYLPDDILAKVDRAAMSVSLETRVPMLDHRVVEFAARLPLSMKIRDRQGKWILRQVLHKYVPAEAVTRPKMGFGIPIDLWLRGPLREWAESLLDSNRLKREGFFNPAPIQRKWREHLSGGRNWHTHIWDVLMFQAWLEAQ